MKVVVKDKIYDSAKEPVVLILSDEDKANIKDMHRSCVRYAKAPPGLDDELAILILEAIKSEI